MQLNQGQSIHANDTDGEIGIESEHFRKSKGQQGHERKLCAGTYEDVPWPAEQYPEVLRR